MPDKHEASHGETFAIPGWGVVTLRGVDACRFAQAQFMGDVAALAPGHWHWNGWLTPKGRVVALFALLKSDESTLRLLLADADPEGFASALSRFVFRSKVAIGHAPGAHVAGRFGAPGKARGAAFAGEDVDGGIELDFAGDDGPRTLRIQSGAAAGDADAAARWRASDLAHGLPRLDASQAGQWTPQQLSLDRLRAYSVRKGCYPGQEIVARTHFLGQAKRGLVRLTADADISVGEVATPDAPGRAVGQVACSAGRHGLAVMPLDAGDGPFLVAGVQCRRFPLLDGLAR